MINEHLWSNKSVQVDGHLKEVTAYFEARGCTVKPHKTISIRDAYIVRVMYGPSWVTDITVYFRGGGHVSVQYKLTDGDPGDV